MSLFSALTISSTGLTAERMRMDTISNNIANMETTRTKNGGPYVRKVVTFEENLNKTLNEFDSSKEKRFGGVKVSSIQDDNSTPIKKIYNPNHPDADGEGYVLMPNVNPLNEMVDLITASRGYEANVTALNTSKQMFMKALEIGR
ncbi:flagellar basal body rod protein FlgC [Clostridium cylindrosporum]|uniref:Flagellar basal-body rod protein FlgC n=1 Tax=Clostridium cylindrosporum DSM 605 TaxID=1121307 RepID=A0A0J8D732_CLOCY|nr:flagellar basal body rod protein FlgC [Clostridium cylindrosporum]KMT21697.1 flagellar basal-body rod protein FlgC [Clostridium cylindrosporum DSM 605]